MNEEFVNTYIEIMNKKIEELTRNEIMFQTRKLIAGLQNENQKLQANKRVKKDEI